MCMQNPNIFMVLIDNASQVNKFEWTCIVLEIQGLKFFARSCLLAQLLLVEHFDEFCRQLQLHQPFVIM